MPKPYVNDVPNSPDPMVVIVPMDRMDIGARKSGMPKAASTGPGSLSHVGGSGGKKG
jgi:hypothetical protein